MKHVISVGGGLASTLFLPMEVLKTVPAKDVVMVMAKLPNEDPDVWRLVEAVENKLQIPVQMIGTGETPLDVFNRVGFLGNSRIDPCSDQLKRKVMREWIMREYPLGSAILYTGIGAHEIDRQMKIVSRWRDSGYEMRMPLINKPELTREYMMAECQKMFGFIPRLYLMGFSHNNCFQRDTRFITDEGVKTFGETHGQTVRVLTSNGKWIETQVQSFGEQPLWRLTLQRYGETKEIYTTANHRWLTYLGQRGKREGESLTKDLKPQTRLVSMPDEFFLIDEHPIRHQNNPPQTKFEAAWRVVSVEKTNRVETVYCVNVPETHNFTLEDNILTGNCGGACIKAGMKEWARLLYFLPDIYSIWESGEKEWQKKYGNYTILKRTVKGKTHYMSLEEFRIMTIDKWNCKPPQYPTIEGWEMVDTYITDYDETPSCSFCDSIA